MGDDPQRVKASNRERIVSVLPYLSAIASIVWGFASAFPDLLTLEQRLLIAGALLILILAGAVAHHVEQKKLVDLAARLEEVADLDASVPTQAIRDLADLIFKRRAIWRLTVYTVESDGNDEWYLQHLVRKSAHQAFARDGRNLIPLDKSVVRGLWNVSLPHGEPTSEAPDPIADIDQWTSWQRHFVRDDEVASKLRMKSRRYAWCAAREADRGERTVVMVAETLEPDGILLESLESPLIFSSLLMIARWFELRGTVAPVVREGARTLQLLKN